MNQMKKICNEIVKHWKGKLFSSCILILLIMTMFQVNVKTVEEHIDIQVIYLSLIIISLLVWIPVSKNNIVRAVGQSIIVVSMPLIMYISVECINGNDITNIVAWKNVLSFWIYLLVYLAIFSVLGNLTVTCIIYSVLCIIIGVANNFVWTFRGSPVLPWDIFSISTAKNVVSEYTFYLSNPAVKSILVSLLFIIISAKLKIKLHSKNSMKMRMIGIEALLITFFVPYCINEKLQIVTEDTLIINRWNQGKTYKDNGTVLAFIENAYYSFNRKPTGYKKEEMDKYLSEVEVLQPMAFNNGVKAVNIIGIMNESYSDLSVVGEFETNQEYLPYYKSLYDNTVKGNLFVSIYGANTPNSEFEFLTGNSLAFLPKGSIPYQTYVNQTAISLSKILKNDGFSSEAMHMYFSSSWNRTSAYPNLGFDSMHFFDDYINENLVFSRCYPSDQASYEKVIELYEKNAGSPQFIFNVTMQNHGGYEFGSPNDVQVIGEKSFPLTNEYLSVLRNSDESLKILIDYFSQIEEPTVIVLFGDHQPAIEKEFLEVLYGKSLDSLNLEEMQRQYTVPFLIWANYDIEERYIENISANYLSTLLMEIAGIELTEYNKFLNNLYLEYPVINANGVIDKEGNYLTLDEAETSEQIKLYKELQYYNLFDGKNMNREFFE